MKLVVEKTLDEMKFIRTENHENIVISNAQGWFLINKDGGFKNKIPYAHKEIDFTSTGMIIVEKKTGKIFCVCNDRGKEIFSIEANLLWDLYYDDYFSYKVDDKWGLLDKTGSILVEPQFDGIKTFFHHRDMA